MKPRLFVVPALLMVHADSADRADRLASQLLDDTDRDSRTFPHHCLDESRETRLYQLPFGEDHDFCSDYNLATTPYGDDRLRDACARLDIHFPGLAFEQPGEIHLTAHGRDFVIFTTDTGTGSVAVGYKHLLPGTDWITSRRSLILSGDADNPAAVAEWIRGEINAYSPEHLLAAAIEALAVFRKRFPLEHGDPLVGSAWGALEDVITIHNGQPA